MHHDVKNRCVEINMFNTPNLQNDKIRVINGSQMFVNAIRSVLSNRVGTEGISKEREFLKSVEFTLSDLNMWDG